MFKGFKFGKTGDKEQPEGENSENLVPVSDVQEQENQTTESIKSVSEDEKNPQKGDKNDKQEEKPEESINIFDDFSLDEDLQKDVTDFNKEKNRDSYDYLSFISGSLTYINLLIFLVILSAFTYVFIQSNDELSDASWLDPVCGVILGSVPNSDYAYCSSISHIANQYKSKLETVKSDQYEKIIKIIPDVYKRYDFINSREMTFLVNKKESRLTPSEIIEEFHKLKDEFSPIDKELIVCNNVSITADNIMNVSCEARSSSWNSGIKGYLGKKGDKVSGTSISIASSFFNFIELESEKFTLLNFPKNLDIVKIELSESGYDRSTDFKLELKYNTDNISL